MHQHATTNRLTQRVSATIIVALACTGLVPAAAQATETTASGSGDTSIVTVEGTLRAAVIHGDDRENGHASEHGSDDSHLAYAIQVDNSFLPVHAEDVPTDEVGAEVTADVIVPQETADAVSTDIIDSGDVATAQDVQEIAAESTTALSAASVTVLESAPTAAATTVGATHNVYLVYVDNGSGTPNKTTVKNQLAETAKYWKAASYGKVGALNIKHEATIKRNVTPGFNFNYCSESEDAVFDLWNSAYSHLRSKGKDPMGSYNHMLLVGPPCKGQTLGIALVGDGFATGGALTIYGPRTDTLIHEFGHNFSLGHSNLAYSEGARPAPYLAFYSPMAGGPPVSYPSPMLDIAYQHLLKIAPQSSISSVPYSGTTINLNAVTANNGVRGATFVDPYSGKRVFVEYRNGQGFDAGAYYIAQPGDLISSGFNISMGKGVRVTTLEKNNDVTTYPLYSGTSPRKSTLQAGESLTGWGSGYTVKVNSMTATAANVTISPSKAKPTLKVANPTAAFGATPRVTTTVTSTLNVAGKVEAKIAGKTVASKTLPTSGTRQVTLNLPKNLKVGKHTVELNYSGSDRVTPGKRNVTLTVTKAKPTVKTALKNATAGKKATLNILVAANNTPSGKAQINIDGKKYKTVTLSKGRATVKLPSSLKVGKHRLAVVYAGDTGHTTITYRRDFTVKKQRASISGLKGGTRTVKKKATYKDKFTTTHSGVLQRYSKGSWRTVKKLKAGTNTLKHRSTTATTTKYRVVIGSTSKRVGTKKTVTIRVK